MTQDENSIRNPEETQNDAEMQHRMDAIEGTLLEDLPDDERLQSGVPTDQRSSEEDFIQMTGLTRPQATAVAPETPQGPAADDMNLERPVSFFEKGVADVDAAMAPRALEDSVAADHDVLTETAAGAPEAEPAADIESLVAELSQAPPPEPSEPAAVAEEPAPAPVPEPTRVPERLDDAAGSVEAKDVKGGLSLGPATEALQEPAPSVPGPVEAPSATASETSSSLETRDRSDLDEAEELLQTLREQPRESYAPSEAVAPPARPDTGLGPQPQVPSSVPREVSDEGAEEDESIYRQPLSPHKRRSRRRRSKARHLAVRWGVRIAAVLAVVCAVYGGYWWAEPRLVTPEKIFIQAQELAAEGKYRRASDAYLEFARLQPNHPSRPQAQFEAGFVLQLAPAGSFDESQRVYQRSFGLYDQFIKDNPGHLKAVRAHCLMGLLQYRLGQYEKAVEVLRNRDLPVQDSSAALPARRILARAYAQLGEYSLAESAYRQAATMPNNYNADVDYHELGDLFLKRAESAQTAEEKTRLQRAAVDNWDHAMRVPGIDPVNKARIKEKRDWLLTEAPEAGEAPPKSTPAEGAALSNEAGTPARSKAASTLDAEPNPAVEAAHLAASRPSP